MANPFICWSSEGPTRNWPRQDNVPGCDEKDRVGPTSSSLRPLLISLRQLSQGLFPRGNQRPLTAPGMKVPIYTAWVVGDKRIVVCGRFLASKTNFTDCF